MHEYENKTFLLLILAFTGFIVTGFATAGPAETLNSFLRLQVSAARLINDFTVIGGTGGALVNAGIMGLLALLLIKVSGVTMSGPTVAATMTIVGFSLFGKTPINALPIIFGVFLASKVASKPFRSYILMAFFGTAFGPLFSYLFAEAGLHGTLGTVLGLAFGTAAGFVFPALAIAMLRMHEGFNLYNMGFTCGFFGFFAASFLAGANQDLTVQIIWNRAEDPVLILLVPCLALLFIVWGLLQDGHKIFKNFLAIMKLSGRLPSDFMESVSPGAAFFNAGLLGLAGVAYLLIIKANFNGPVLGGLLTVMGFATFGKHPRNTVPIALGVIVATLVFGKSLTDPGPVLALLFATTLAPLAGEFGPFVGFAAGFVHLLVVERSAAWHGGLNLYNNGLAGGLTATLFVAIIQWFKSFKKTQ